MAGNTGKQRVVVTGHNIESPTRVAHYLRPVGTSNSGLPLELQGGVLIVTDDKSIIPDGTEIDIDLSFTVVAAAPAP
jgi:hypothetical protein